MSALYTFGDNVITYRTESVHFFFLGGAGAGGGGVGPYKNSNYRYP